MQCNIYSFVTADISETIMTLCSATIDVLAITENEVEGM
jgi:hypothetical protein